MKNLIIVILFAGLVSFTSYGKGRTPNAATATATNYSTCTSGGTESDVNISITAKAEVQIENSECSVNMNLVKKTDKKFLVFKGIQSDDSDTDLCGGSAVISANILKGGTPITLKLQGGESGGTYTCTK